jgi:hypothetical protein
MATLSAWQNFYVIIGSSGAALIGIQFVVIALIADIRHRTTANEIKAFATPTVMHLGGALLVSAVMSAPWPSLFSASVAVGLCGVAGFVYGATVIYRTRRQTGYKPEWGDWLWYAILPCGIYVALAAAALSLQTNTQVAQFVIGGVAFSLLLIGIHNAWDAVTYMLLVHHSDSTKKDR